MSAKLVVLVFGALCLIASYFSPAYPLLQVAVLLSLIAHIVP